MNDFKYVIKAPFSDEGLLDKIKGIFGKQKEETPSVVLADNGFTFNLDTQKIFLPFNKCKNIYATAFMYTSDINYTAMYMAFFIELFEQADLDISFNYKSNKGTLPFVNSVTDFSEYQGVAPVSGVYINAASGPAVDIQNFLKSKGFELKRQRPAMKVKDTQEYNTLIKDIVSEEFYQEYKL